MIPSSREGPNRRRVSRGASRCQQPAARSLSTRDDRDALPLSAAISCIACHDRSSARRRCLKRGSNLACQLRIAGQSRKSPSSVRTTLVNLGNETFTETQIFGIELSGKDPVVESLNLLSQIRYLIRISSLVRISAALTRNSPLRRPAVRSSCTTRNQHTGETQSEYPGTRIVKQEVRYLRILDRRDPFGVLLATKGAGDQHHC